MAGTGRAVAGEDVLGVGIETGDTRDQVCAQGNGDKAILFSRNLSNTSRVMLRASAGIVLGSFRAAGGVVPVIRT
jgi:hypothetical protein